MRRISGGQVRVFVSESGGRVPGRSDPFRRSGRLRRFASALSLASLLSGGLAATPGFAEEPASAPDGGAAAQALTFEFDARPKATSGGLSLQLGGGSWERAVDELQSDQLAWDGMGQLAQQAPDAEGGGAGNVLANPDEISRQSNNPLGGDFILWLNFFDIDQLEGEITDEKRYSYSHLLQPVIPIKLPSIGEDWILVNRPTFPSIFSREIPTGPNLTKPGIARFSSRGGFGDIEYLALMGTSTSNDSGFLAESFGEGDAVLAAGFTTRFPTGRSSVSENVYAAGPAATAAYIGKDWTLATLIQHWWDYSQQSAGDDFNFTRAQLFYFRSFPGGWQIGGTPKITVDWTASGDDKLTLPIGFGVFKTILLGALPIKLGVEFRPSIIRPDSLGTEWQIEFEVIPVTPNFIGKMFN